MKALCIFSGGLDSLIATLILRNNGIDVLAVFFETPFFRSENARISAERIGIPFISVDITARHFKMLENPPHGYGANMNPCIDCHALMFKIAGEMLSEERASFIATGEVLGQRPFSQNKRAMAIVAKESGIADLILRPLSARLLSPSLPEREGWVAREALLGLQGRSRKPQIRLARNLGITEYETPAGGCVLTKKAFSRRLKDLMLFKRKLIDPDQIGLLRAGRHFRLSPEAKAVVGRNLSDNEKIAALADEEDIIMSVEFFPGPTTLISGEPENKDIITAASLTLSYSDAAVGTVSSVTVNGRQRPGSLLATALPIESFRHLMI